MSKPSLDNSFFVSISVEAGMFNESICVVESQLSDVEILDIGKWGGGGIAFGLTIVSAIGLIVHGLFIYYLKYEAPKERPINTLMLHDQVRHLLIKAHNSSVIRSEYLQALLSYRLFN